MSLTEFHNIMPIENITSVLEHGIVSYAEAVRHKHRSVALQDVQDKRKGKKVPGGHNLHEYANVYFHARNPMMSCRRSEAADICVLQISKKILDLPNVVITDQNAASSYVRFMPPSMIGSLNLDYIFAKNWKHPENQIEEWKHSSAKCAEVLVPHAIAPNFILGAYVVNCTAQNKLNLAGFNLPIIINANLFFS